MTTIRPCECPDACAVSRCSPDNWFELDWADETPMRALGGPDQAEPEGWRRWVTSYAEQVTVGPAVRGRNRFDPDRVTIEWRQR